ncbi:MAG: hypothetical protein AABN34_13965 [Acidobacteriota bacterium]
MKSEESVSGRELHKCHAGRSKAKTDDGILVSFDGDVGLARKILRKSRDEGDRMLWELIDNTSS